MSTENAEEGKEQQEQNKCEFEKICIPQEVRIKYFPRVSNKFAYDVLPLFEVDDYNRKTMKELSILENPVWAARWNAFQKGLPDTAKALKPKSIGSQKLAVFANYRRQKVPLDYYASFIAPSSPDPIFRKQK